MRAISTITSAGTSASPSGARKRASPSAKTATKARSSTSRESLFWTSRVRPSSERTSPAALTVAASVSSTKPTRFQSPTALGPHSPSSDCSSSSGELSAYARTTEAPSSHSRGRGSLLAETAASTPEASSSPQADAWTVIRFSGMHWACQPTASLALLAAARPAGSPGRERVARGPARVPAAVRARRVEAGGGHAGEAGEEAAQGAGRGAERGADAASCAHSGGARAASGAGAAERRGPRRARRRTRRSRRAP